MALEDLLKELITSTKDLTETTKALMALRSDAIEAVKKDAAPVAKATTKPAETKPAETKAAETKAAEPEVTSAAGVDPKVYEEIAASIGAYVGGATREEERAARKDKVKKLLQHDAIKKPGTPDNVFDAANIKADAIQVFKDNLAALVTKGDLTTAPAAASNLLD